MSGYFSCLGAAFYSVCRKDLDPLRAGDFVLFVTRNKAGHSGLLVRHPAQAHLSGALVPR